MRLEMLQVARLAPKLLGESKDLVAGFLEHQITEGAFLDRSGRRYVPYGGIHYVHHA